MYWRGVCGGVCVGVWVHPFIHEDMKVFIVKHTYIHQKSGAYQEPVWNDYARGGHSTFFLVGMCHTGFKK